MVRDFAFEIIGDIAIIEVGKEKGKEYGNKVLEKNKNVNVVLNKIGDIKDVYRVGRYKEVVKRNKNREFDFVKKKYRKVGGFETIHKENGVFIKLDVSKVYFSPRLSSERKRIMEMVKDGEVILSLFSGVGPFPLVIAKYKDVEIYANEINPDAVYYMRQNIEMNNLKGNIYVMEGDAKDVLKEIKDMEKFDRVLMPAPKDAPFFLEDVLKRVRKGCVIHLYAFSDEKGIKERDKEKEVLDIAGKSGRKVEIRDFRICGNIGVRQHRVVLDIKVMD